MTSQNSSSQPKLALWVWPTGMYPRRVIYYLKAKALPHSVLDNLDINMVTLDLKAGTLEPQPGFEARPAGTSLPVLRVGDRFIYQSSSILAYLEEVFGPSLSGQDAVHRAHVADIVQHINEAQVWTNVYIRHTTEMSRMWSGMTEQQQSAAAGEDALKQWRSAMARLETWVKDDVLNKKAASIAGGGEPNLADFTLMGTRDYLFEMYGWDVFEGFEVLNVWYDRARQSHWYVDKAGCEEIENDGFDALFGK